MRYVSLRFSTKSERKVSQGSVETLFRRGGNIYTTVWQIYSGQQLPKFIRIGPVLWKTWQKYFVVVFSVHISVVLSSLEYCDYELCMT